MDTVSGVLFCNLVLACVFILVTADQVLVIDSLWAQFSRTVCFNGFLAIFSGFSLFFVEH